MEASWYGYDVGEVLQISLTVVYSVTLITALLGNLILLRIIRLRRPPTTVSILLSSMAVSDLLTALFVMPYTICYLYVQQEWFPGVTGVITCKFINFVVGTTIAVSIFALLTISLERYMAVVRPMLYPSFIKRPILFSAAIWVFSALFMSFYLYIHDTYTIDGVTLCVMDWEPLFSNEYGPKFFFSSVAAILYVVPLFIIAILSCLIIKKLNRTKTALSSDQPAEHLSDTFRKRHQRVMRMLIVIVVLFTVCWLPVHVIHILVYFYGEIYMSLPPSLPLFLFWVSHLNSALNPCVVILLNDSFRKSFRVIFHSLCRGNHIPSSNINKTCRNGCLPRRRARMYSVVQWSKRDNTTPLTVFEVKHE